MGLPVGGLGAGRFEGPGADGDDQAGFFGQADELDGCQEAPLGVLPAQERFEPEELPGFQVDDGLVVHRIRGDRAGCRLGLDSMVAPGPARIVEHFGAGSPVVLARYMAVSASRTSLSGVSSGCLGRRCRCWRW